MRTMAIALAMVLVVAWLGPARADAPGGSGEACAARLEARAFEYCYSPIRRD